MILLSKINRSHKKLKPIFVAAIVIIFFNLSLYWLKNQIGIDLLQTISLGKYFPFKYIDRPKNIGIDKQGILLSENFDSYQLFNKWHGIYIEGEGKILKSVSSSGQNGSRCLLIINKEVKNWSISHNKFVEVNIDDHFTYSAKVKIAEGNPTANICVDSFDENMKIMTWGYSKIMLNELDKWVKLGNSLTINNVRVRYIRFRISGTGKGEYYFDNILFERQVRSQ